MKVSFELDDSLTDKFQRATGLPIKDIVTDALSLYNWAVDETVKGRVVHSSSPTFTEPRQLVIPSLERAKKLST